MLRKKLDAMSGMDDLEFSFRGAAWQADRPSAPTIRSTLRMADFADMRANLIVVFNGLRLRREAPATAAPVHSVAQPSHGTALSSS